MRVRIPKRLLRYRDLIDDWPALVDCLRRPLPGVIRTNRLRLTPPRLRRLLADDGIDARALAWNPDAFLLGDDAAPGRRWWFLAGLAHSQEAASQLPVRLLDPRPGERVLDLCAAPGGKTAQMVAAMGNRGTVVANDVRVDRMRALASVIARLGLGSVATTVHDGASYPRAAGGFDRVLADAPCSGEGTLRKHPALWERLDAEPGARYAPLQQRLLARAVEVCRPGGRIVYSTCTFAPEENELVLQAVLARFGAVLCLRPARIDGVRLDPGLTYWQGRRLDPQLAQAGRLWPQRHDTGGFFMAVLEKLGGEALPQPAPVAALDSDVVAAVLSRHGIDAAALDGWVPCRRSSRSLWLASADLRPPPQAVSVGLAAFSTQTRPPKLSTAGALLFAARARRQVVDLGRGQLEAYFARQTFAAGGPDGAGSVVVRHQGFGIGTAYWDGRVLQSLFPKVWGGVGQRAGTSEA